MIQTRLHTEDTPEKILADIEPLYKMVSSTMGPYGLSVLIRKWQRKAFATNDGFTVAQSVDNAAPSTELMVDAARKLDSLTGDATTTVITLIYHILRSAVERIKAGESPTKIRLELEAAEAQIIEQIKTETDKKVGKHELIDVATISGKSPVIGKEVGSLIFKARHETPVVLGRSDTSDTYTEVIDGFKISSAPASPYLLQGLRREIENPKIIVVDAKLLDKGDVLPLFQVMSQLPQEQRRVLLVVSEIASDALSLMVVNNLKGFAEIAVTKVPAHIGSPTEFLQDVAVATGATLLSRNSADSIVSPSLDHFGSARKVIVDAAETVIVEGAAIGEDMDAHISGLKAMAKDSKDKVSRKLAEDRLSTLKQKIVSVRVGGQTESAADAKYYLYEDAVGAARAALRGGVVPGGGTLLYSIDTDSQTLREALKQPFVKILSNAGIPDPTKVSFWDKLRGRKPQIITTGYGIDVRYPERGVIDMIDQGILDPAESQIECIRTAIAVASIFITAGGIIDDELTETKNSEASQQITPN